MAGPQPGMQSYAYPAIPPYQAQSTVHQGEQPNDPIVVPDLDDPKEKSDFQKNPPEPFEDPSAKGKLEFLEERLRAIEGTNTYGTVEALQAQIGDLTAKVNVLMRVIGSTTPGEGLSGSRGTASRRKGI